MISFFCLFFFFKQKTAYDMRISDWSSDVCSSDLVGSEAFTAGALEQQHAPGRCADRQRDQRLHRHPAAVTHRDRLLQRDSVRGVALERQFALAHRRFDFGLARRRNHHLHVLRSEEHTSELQSLMRISYAVFCLKKKQTLNNGTTILNTGTSNTRNAKQYSKLVKKNTPYD